MMADRRTEGRASALEGSRGGRPRRHQLDAGQPPLRGARGRGCGGGLPGPLPLAGTRLRAGPRPGREPRSPGRTARRRRARRDHGRLRRRLGGARRSGGALFRGAPTRAAARDGRCPRCAPRQRARGGLAWDGTGRGGTRRRRSLRRPGRPRADRHDRVLRGHGRPQPRRARSIVAAAERPNLGLLVDVARALRGGDRPRARHPPGPADPLGPARRRTGRAPGGYAHATRYRRLVPGEERPSSPRCSGQSQTGS